LDGLYQLVKPKAMSPETLQQELAFLRQRVAQLELTQQQQPLHRSKPPLPCDDRPSPTVGDAVPRQSASFWELFDQSADAVLLLDNGVFVDCNEAAMRMLRCDSKAAVLSLHPAQLSPEIQPDGQASIAKANDMITAAFQQGSHRFEWMFRRSDGKEFWIEVLLTVVAIDGKPMLHTTWREIDDRKRAEAKLRQSEARFRTIAATMPGAIFQFSVRHGIWTVDYISDRIYDITGVTAAEIMQDMQVLVNRQHPEDFDRYIAAIVAATENLTPWQYKGRLIKPTGDVRWWQGESIPTRNEQGEIVFCGVLLDITDRIQAEQTLQESEERFRQLAEHIESVFWMTDADKSKMLYVSPAYETIWQRSVAQLYQTPQSFLDAIHPGDRDRVLSSVSRQAHAKYTEIYRILQPNGEARWIRDRAFPISNQQGQIYRIVGIAEDITHYKQAEEALQQSAEQLRQQAQRERLLNRLTTCIRDSLDFQTILNTTVQEIREFLGVDRCHFAWYYQTPEESYWDVVSESHQPELPDLIGHYAVALFGSLSDIVLQQNVLRLDNVAAIANKTIRRVLQSLRTRSLLVIPMCSPAGVIGTVSCIHSQSTRTWSDEEVELLQAVVQQLAIALNQAELYEQSRTKADELETALTELQRTQAHLIQGEKMSSLGQLVAGVAHEINNPVNFIYGNLTHASEYIRDLLRLIHLYQAHYPVPAPEIVTEVEAIDLDFLIEDLPNLLASMRIGAERIQKIVSSLRVFSRMDEAEFKAVDVHEGIDSTLLILQNRLKSKPIRVAGVEHFCPTIEINKCYGNLPLVECYAGQLNQVFMNILSNAIDALEEKSANQLSTATESKTEALADSRLESLLAITICTEIIAQQVTIRISDNGLGIPEAVRQRLFDPFFTTKPVGKGTGMGLSISHQIVTERHKGTLNCVSQLGQGTEFIIQIPLHQSDE
jgi:two-component system, NtrC family, sensor kinase